MSSPTTNATQAPLGQGVPKAPAVQGQRAPIPPSHRVVEEFLGRAVLNGERAATALRAAIVLLALAQFLVYGGAVELLQLTPRSLVVTFTLAFAGLGSMTLLRTIRTSPFTESQIIGSVALDAFIVMFATFPTAWWVTPQYPGLLSLPTFAFFLLAILASGLRLSIKAAVIGSSLNILGVSCVLLVDQTRGLLMGPYGSKGVALALVLLFGASILSLLIAQRTRRLVFEGAQAAVVAERARQRLEQYVSEEVAEEAMQTDSIQLSGTRRPVAVLFCDIRGFTEYADKVEPETLVSELNAYLDAMVTEIRAEQGVVDKYLGDGLMAVFGMTEAHPEDPVRALKAALGMQRALTVHNLERADRGRPPLRHGIGVHFGEVVAGNIGTSRRLQFTVVGDTVNVASRLETATKSEGVDVIISAAAVDAAYLVARTIEVPRVMPHALLQLPGHPKPIQTFRLATTSM